MLKLKEQLMEAQNEINRLSSERSDVVVSSNSPSSSMTMEAMDVEAPFLGEFGMVDGYNDAFYMAENNYMNAMEWINLYM